MHKILLILVTALFATVMRVEADLGWTLEQCKASYGAPTFGPGRAHNAVYYVWEHPDGFYMAFMSSAGNVMAATYGAYKPFDNSDLFSLFKREAPNAKWEPFSFPNQPAGHLYWVGRENESATMIAESFVVVRHDGTNSYCVTVGTPQAMVWMSENP